MSLDENNSWLDALAGRTDVTLSGADAGEPGAEPTPSRALALEGRALREFIRAQAFDGASDVPTVDAARERELIERARTEGLLPRQGAGPQAVSSAPLRRRWFADTRITLAAAALVLAALGVGLWRSTLQPTETLRGSVNGTVHLEARDPSGVQRQLTRELNAAGVRVESYERLGHIGIDADLPRPVPSQIVEILERHHIPIPADGVLVVEFDAPGRQ
jgi:hypothetical protein